uniref:Serpentine receptor class gamma n=1 Tax=Caenorhabditis japonica TaxID=281687 RepID=A0A8R1DJP5_CAEJA
MVEVVFYVEQGEWKSEFLSEFHLWSKAFDTTAIVVSEFLAILFITLTYYRLQKLKLKIGHLEINLILVTALHFFPNLCILIPQFTAFVPLKTDITAFLNKNIYYTIYIITISHSVTIILTHKPIRKGYFEIIGLRKHIPITPILNFS